MEIALIKLCQPVMETNLDSLYDRVRVLEEKLKNGVVAAPPVSQGVTDTSVKTAEHTKTEPQPKPEKAAPEDLQYVRQNWNAIIRDTKGLLQQMLLESTPKYDGSTGEPVLYVEFRNFLAKTCMDSPDSMEMLKNAIRKKIGKDIEIKMILKDGDAGETRGGLSEITVDDLLMQNINMEISVETMEDDE